MKTRPEEKLTIVGGGIIGALEAYFAYLDHIARITIYDKNATINETTTKHIVPSLTPDEILSVVPRGQELVNKLKLKFNQPGGIRVDDAANANTSNAAADFKSEALIYSQDEIGHKLRTKNLLELGKLSMELWQYIYDTADKKLKTIFEQSNFNPCREPKSQQQMRHDGYRIDLIYNVADAKNRAMKMKADYEDLGYQHCKVLSPCEVKKLDPFLADFCQAHQVNENEWQNNTVALWRPGGCLDTQVFLPKFYKYLSEKMGQYVNEKGQSKNRFQLKFGRKVEHVQLETDNNELFVTGLGFFGKPGIKENNHYAQSNYVFCPGEAVGTMQQLGFDDPAYAGFAGASLMLNIPIPADKLAEFASFNHCMEVHQEGVVLAWQARFRDNKIFIGVAGTKAFYGDQRPDKDQEFAKDRNLLQLNMVNDVLPEFISLALGRNTKGEKLTETDLSILVEKGIAERWVGVRATTFDGYPSVGKVYKDQKPVRNARETKDLSSGGVSDGPVFVKLSRDANKEMHSEIERDALSYGDSRRRMSR